MTQAVGTIQTFDQQVAAGLVGGQDVPLELPAEQQYRGTLWPNPADNIADHSSEGAPYQAATGTRNLPYDATKDTSGVLAPAWADHDGYVPPFNVGVVVDPRTGSDISAPADPRVHEGSGITLSLPSAENPEKQKIKNKDKEQGE